MAISDLYEPTDDGSESQVRNEMEGCQRDQSLWFILDWPLSDESECLSQASEISDLAAGE